MLNATENAKLHNGQTEPLRQKDRKKKIEFVKLDTSHIPGVKDTPWTAADLVDHSIRTINVQSKTWYDQRSWNVLYIIKDYAGYYKIGHAMKGRPRCRVRELQTAHALPLELVYVSDYESPVMHGLENEIHKILESHGLRMNGEWFDLSDEMFENVIEWIKEDEEKLTTGEGVDDECGTVSFEYKKTLSRYAA